MAADPSAGDLVKCLNGLNFSDCGGRTDNLRIISITQKINVAVYEKSMLR